MVVTEFLLMSIFDVDTYTVHYSGTRSQKRNTTTWREIHPQHQSTSALWQFEYTSLTRSVRPADSLALLGSRALSRVVCCKGASPSKPCTLISYAYVWAAYAQCTVHLVHGPVSHYYYLFASSLHEQLLGLWESTMLLYYARQQYFESSGYLTTPRV